MRFLQWYWSYTLHEDDDALVTARKRTYQVLYPSLVALLALLCCLPGSELLQYSTYAYTTGTVACFVHMLATRTLPNSVFWLHITMTYLYICALDLNATASSTDRVWPLFVLQLDVLLICRAPHLLSKVFVVLIVMWLMFTYVEGATRFGLFDLPGTRSAASRRSLFDCTVPPCANVTISVMGFMTVSTTFLLDYHFTRGFATDVLKEKSKIEMAVRAAEEVAAALAAFDIDTAEETLSETQLPGPLQSAFSSIVANLKLYRPFLPEALFEEMHASANALPFKSGQFNIPPGSNSSHAALVFTDIQSSTALWEACPVGMKKALKKHNTIIREEMTTHHGYEVKTIGDAFMVAFESVTSAVEFALAVQLGLYNSVWPSDLMEVPVCAKAKGMWNGLRVRIGIHSGEIELELNSITGRFDYFGPTVNKAARIESAAVGGGIAVSEEVFGVLHSEGVLSGQAAPPLIQMGEKILKGVPGKAKLTMLIPSALVGRRAHLELQLKSGTAVAPQSPTVEVKSSSSSSQREPSMVYSPSPQPYGVMSSRFESIGSVTVGKADLFRVGVEETYVDAATPVNEDLCRVLQYLERSGGTAMVLVGGALTVGWNVSKKCATHFESAMRWVSLGHGLKHKGVVVGVASGQVVSGTFGTSSQRFIASIGGCMTVCSLMTAAAAEFGTFAVFGTTTVDAFFASYKIDLQTFLRPLDTWYLHTAPTLAVTVYEVSPPRVELDGFAGLAHVKSTEENFGWSAAYWSAFKESDHVAISNNMGSDPVAAKVAGRLRTMGNRIVYH